jgi:hypothetical protein
MASSRRAPARRPSTCTAPAGSPARTHDGGRVPARPWTGTGSCAPGPGCQSPALHAGSPGSHPLDRVIEADTVGGCLCFHTSAGRSSIWILGRRPKTTRPTSAAVSTSTRTHGTCTNMTAIKRPLQWVRLGHPVPVILPGCGRQRLRPMAGMGYAECSRCAGLRNLGRLPGGRPRQRCR